MPIISFISFSFFIILFLTLFKKDTDIFSPARLFILVWLMAIGLVGLKFSGLQKEWTAYSWMILFINLASVLLGIFVVYILKFQEPNKSVFEIRNSITNASINNKLLFKIIILLFFTYITSYLIIYSVVGFIPIFTKRPDLTRTKWGLFGAGLIIHIVPTILYFIVIYFLKVKGQVFNKVSLGIIAIISFVSFLFLVQRFDLVIFIVTMLVFLYYATFKLKFKYILLFIIGFAYLMYGVSNIRSSILFLEYLYYSGKMNFGIQYAIFTEPYMYVVMNLENFANAVNKLTDFTYGYYTFDFILALTGLKHWIADYSNIQSFPFIVNEAYNTYSMFFVYYRDFGIIGSFLFPFLLGIGISSSYSLLRRYPSVHFISFYAMFVFTIIFSFFIPMLSWLHFVFNLFLMFFISKIILNK